MAISNNVEIEDWAAAVVDANGTVRKARGCQVSFDPGFPGVYSVLLDKGITEEETIADITFRTPQGTSNKTAYLAHLSETAKEVQIVNASAGSNQGFTLQIRKLLP